LESLRTTPLPTSPVPTTIPWSPTIDPSSFTSTLPASFNVTDCTKRLLPCSALRHNKSSASSSTGGQSGDHQWALFNGTGEFPEFSIMVHENNFSRTYFAPDLFPSPELKEELQERIFDSGGGGVSTVSPFVGSGNSTTTLNPDFLAKLDQGTVPNRKKSTSISHALLTLIKDTVLYFDCINSF
jgi:hypothetical protein